MSLEVELDVLSSIYPEIMIESAGGVPIGFSLFLQPSDISKSFTSVCLKCDLRKYPHVIPTFSLTDVKGLSHQNQSILMNCIIKFCGDKEEAHCLIESMSFLSEVVQLIRDTLSHCNYATCSICLDTVTDKDTVQSTPCSHNFHSHCLAAYSSHSLQEHKLKESEYMEPSQARIKSITVRRNNEQNNLVDLASTLEMVKHNIHTLTCGIAEYQEMASLSEEEKIILQTLQAKLTAGRNERERLQ
jgi:hypothetical protein